MMASADLQHLSIMESVTERQFMRPNRNYEKVIHNRVAGFKEPSFVALVNDVQPFSFYNNHFKIADKLFLNPISPGSTKKYFFNMEDTLYQQSDTVFIISFHPRKNKNFEGMEGVLYINSRQYAIQNVIASPHDKSFFNMKIEQKYKLINNQQWFPEQLNFEMEAAKYPSPFLRLLVEGRSYIYEVDIAPSLSKKNFNENLIEIDEEAHMGE